MSYITPDEYVQLSGLDPPHNIEELILQASVMIDALTMHRIHTFTSLPDWVQQRVKFATAEQVTFLDQNGGADGDSLTSVSLGKFSYSKGTMYTRRYASMVEDYLLPTGLLYRGNAVI